MEMNESIVSVLQNCSTIFEAFILQYSLERPQSTIIHNCLLLLRFWLRKKLVKVYCLRRIMLMIIRCLLSATILNRLCSRTIPMIIDFDTFILFCPLACPVRATSSLMSSIGR